ncbi:MAG: hypothetical protein HC853_06215 [Anaerolineae bacterium]|nr:hypothetical protein [Anaerolineae bacterium]
MNKKLASVIAFILLSLAAIALPATAQLNRFIFIPFVVMPPEQTAASGTPLPPNSTPNVGVIVTPESSPTIPLPLISTPNDGPIITQVPTP